MSGSTLCHSQPPYTSRFQFVNLFELSVLIVLTKTNTKLLFKIFYNSNELHNTDLDPRPLYNAL